ncbi:MAG: asparagine synthase (glutamine-hydrolyzing) [Rhodospirillaceae bacterium]|jgi:asparagine synthase (glutamine-hydrolysing)|nr:asparagine synthase (glutamine-hydrolyzing) [Rhodospirillaceae bacterium]MBT5659991.1 asparagine synthase (glutamine-hydrolyzing) [Rhodospirillaceae bacterium]MBT5751565.1 asparagine synthase (glutamine-hydrolyzing) [Rhodospirillaceae bacterium]
MCGFAALFEPGRNFEPALLDAMENDLFHRGPDSGGRAQASGWGLIFRRLAILDPGAGADQPMNDRQGRCTLVFNGEIYNYKTLRAELEGRGASFRTNGDTEVLLEGYRQWGEGFFDRLEGMYALALVDRDRGVALVARDPLGIKPLYMLKDGDRVAFASEMRPLYRLSPPRVDEAALAELITFGWAAGSLSNIKGIERLPGGTLVSVPLDGGAIKRRRFCDPLDTLEPNENLSAEDAEAQICDALAKSVSAHLASDVGYTVQLSGGVDSSLVTAMAAPATQGKLTSFSVGLGGHAYDETPYQKMVIERYGLDHHEMQITGSAYAEALPRAVRHMEGPVPHGGCVTLMLLCDRIAKTSKVVLTGEGADEMFGGYLRYGRWRKTMWQERLSRVLPTGLMPDTWPFAGMRRIGGRDAAVYESVYHDFKSVQSVFPGLIPGSGAREAASRRFKDFRDRLFAVDQSAYLESLLMRQDKMSMAASVEARVPFVHLPLLRAVNALPRDIRAPGGVTKPLLKKIAGDYLSSDLIHRRKIGLWLPYHEWLADEKGTGRYLEALTGSDSRLGQYADRQKLGDLVAAMRAGNRGGGLVLERLIGTELWLRSLKTAA